MPTLSALLTTQPSLRERGLEDIIEEVVSYYKAYLETMDEEAYAGLIRALNKYLEQLAPLKRAPGLLDISEEVSLSFWDARVNPELLQSLLEALVELRVSGAGFEKALSLVKRVLALLACEEVEVEKLVGTSEDLISLGALLLVLGTNPP
ncbi:MAG: hypothetical protein ACP5KA_03140 [Desulfurococcaceae archaeon]